MVYLRSPLNIETQFYVASRTAGKKSLSFLSNDLLFQLLSSCIKIHVCVVANTLFTISFTHYYNETAPKDKQLSGGEHYRSRRRKREWSVRQQVNIPQEQTWEIGSARLKFNEKKGTRTVGVLPSSGSSGRVRGGLRNMKSMRPPSVAIFFMTYFYRAGGGGHGPLGPPWIRYCYHTSNNGLLSHRQLTIVCTIDAIYCSHFFRIQGRTLRRRHSRSDFWIVGIPVMDLVLHSALIS